MKDIFQEFYQDNRFICIALPVCLILGIISMLVSPSDGKKIKNHSYVYSDSSYVFQENIKSYLPVVNLKGKDATSLNQKLKKIYQQENTILTYDYDLSGDYLSVIYCIITFKDSLPSYDVETAVFSLPKRKLLKTEDLLSLYKIDEKTVRDKMEEKMKYFYQDASNLGYIEQNECDYDCFISSRDYQNNKPLNLAIENEQLVAYQAFQIYGVYDEESYFKESDFRFEITSLNENSSQ